MSFAIGVCPAGRADKLNSIITSMLQIAGLQRLEDGCWTKSPGMELGKRTGRIATAEELSRVRFGKSLPAGGLL